MKEINDETDDMLEEYAENLIRRSLAGEELPSNNLETNNSYYIQAISPSLAQEKPSTFYHDEMIYIEAKHETEPARVLRQIFRDKKNHYYELTVATPTIDKKDLQAAILNAILILYLSLLIIIVFISFWILHKSLKPLHRLLIWLDKNNLNTQSEPITIKTNVLEFQKLNVAVEDFANRAHSVYEQQKQFIGNASHEIQTPIAICQNRLELLCESGLTESQLQELSKVMNTLRHISKLNKSLLLLSKIDNGQFDSSDIDISRLIERFLPDYKEIYSYRNINVEMMKEGQCVVEMNETLAITLITNLIKNAFIHTPVNGRIVIESTKDFMRIYNTGEKALDAKHIFERFHQGEKKEGSTGLGLAIVDAICNLYHFRRSYCFNNHYHIFEIKF